MRKLVSLFLFLVFTIIAFGQDYSLFQTNDTNSYKVPRMIIYPETEVQVNSLAVDSVILVNEVEKLMFPRYMNRSHFSSCNRVAPSFFGESLNRDTSGVEFLINRKKDTLWFKQRVVSADSSWVLYQLDSLMSLKATQLADTIFELPFGLDSIKRFELNLYEGQNKRSDNLNGLIVSISKSHGVVNGLDFFNLNYEESLRKITFSEVQFVGKRGEGGVFSATRGEIFDFNIGDEFHYDYYYGYPGGHLARTTKSWTNDIYIVKEVERQANYVSYTFDKTRIGEYSYVDFDAKPNPIWTEPEFISEKSVIKVTYDKLSELYSGLAGTISKESSSGETEFYLPIVKEGQHFLHKYSETYKFINDSCLGLALEFGPNLHEYAAPGLGYWYDNDSGGSLSGYLKRRKWLIYYKKGNKEWGTPASIARANKQQEVFKIFPNPTAGVIHIPQNFKGDLSLFELSGREVLQSNINGNNVDLSELPNGLYILQLNTTENQYFTRIQIQH